MKNIEKYKYGDRARAFYDWCAKNGCRRCPLSMQDHVSRVECALRWLYMESEEEQPLPCPCCGNNMLYKHDIYGDAKTWISCKKCGYRSPWEFNLDAAVSRHNEIARIMARGKKCEK